MWSPVANIGRTASPGTTSFHGPGVVMVNLLSSQSGDEPGHGLL
jgi:hypothetical protein